MRPLRILVIAAGLLVVVGIVLVVTARIGDADSYGWFAYAPLSDSVSSGGSLVVLSKQEILGWAAGWLGTLIAAGALGHRIAARRQS